jgi:hypothetical protein
MGVQSNEELGTADVHYRSHNKLLKDSCNIACL